MKFLDAKRIRPPGKSPGGGPSADKLDPSSPEKAPAGSALPPGSSGEAKVQKNNATAAAAKLAEGWGLDLATIQGTGAEGRITTSDVIDAHDRALESQRGL